MSSAEPSCIRFFKTTELVVLFTPLLKAHDFAQLLQVSHQLYDSILPFFWRVLNVQSSNRPNRLLVSTEAVQSLASNAHHIHYLKTRAVFTAFYVASVLTTQKELLVASGNNDLNYPAWLPLTFPFKSHDHFPFAPMISLRRLDYSMEWRDYEFNQDEHKANFNPEEHTNLVCWFITTTPALTHLTLRDLPAPSFIFLRLLIRIISRLENLRCLEIRSGTPELMALSTVLTLFNCLPSSLCSLGLAFEIYDDLDETPELRMVPTDNDWSEGPLVKRKGPMVNLGRLKMPVLSNGYRAAAICPILEQCPNLKTFAIPTLADSYASRGVATAIQHHCSGIKWVLIQGQHLHDGKGVLNALEAIPHQQLEMLIKDSDYVDLGPERMNAILQNHLSTLQLVKFAGFCKVSGTTIQAILTGCPMLEELEIRPRVPGDAYAMLEDVAAADWVCHKLKFLKLAVGQTIEDQGSDDVAVHRRRANFRELARQIGTLHRLKVLVLAAVTIGPAGYAVHGEFRFPGFVTLEDPTIGRHGYLQLLSGLRDLRDVRGNLLTRALNRPGALGRNEIKWIARHWPGMRKKGGCEPIPWEVKDMTAKMNFSLFLALLDTQRPLIKLKLAADYLRYVEVESEDWIQVELSELHL
ncbi:hypothetical protein BGX23_006509 [Mortierella sp. AD031]|nr:hypothetical protein BGX23_006509 [Mortierella sp. AD031]